MSTLLCMEAREINSDYLPGMIVSLASVGSKDLNSGPQAIITSTLPTEPFSPPPFPGLFFHTIRLEAIHLLSTVLKGGQMHCFQ